MQDFGLGPRIADDGHSLLRYILSLNPAGTAIEFGVGEGNTARIIAEAMPLIGFDSFQGLPEKWRDGFDAGTFACEPPDIPNTRLVAGIFEDTLPGFQWPEHIGLVHFDADLYTSTATALKHIGPHLRSGCIVIFDEWHGFPEASPDAHEQKAWREFAHDTGIGWTVIGHAPEQWAIRIA